MTYLFNGDDNARFSWLVYTRILHFDCVYMKSPLQISVLLALCNLLITMTQYRMTFYY